MIPGQHISKELRDALGLPKHTRGFTLRCYVDRPVTVECEYYPDGSFQAALSEYTLAPLTVAKSSDARVADFDRWMRERTKSAHAAFMERTSRRLPCDLTTCQDPAGYTRVS
jgi:hypothetical protein